MNACRYFGEYFEAIDFAQVHQRLSHRVNVRPMIGHDHVRYFAIIDQCAGDLGGDAITMAMTGDIGGDSEPSYAICYNQEFVWSHYDGVFYFDDEDAAVAFRLKAA
jgi:hypothetical protein